MENLGFSHSLVIVKNAVNRNLQISLPECAFNSSAYIIRSRITVVRFLFACDEEDVHILRYGDFILTYNT